MEGICHEDRLEKKRPVGILDYAPATHIVRKIVQTIHQHHLPAGVLLNVNIPYLPLEQITGYNLTRQGMRLYRDRLDQRMDPRGRAYFWIGGEAPTGLARTILRGPLNQPVIPGACYRKYEIRAWSTKSR